MSDGYDRDDEARRAFASHVRPMMPSGLPRPTRLPSFRVPVRVDFPEPQFAPPAVPQPFTPHGRHMTMRPPSSGCDVPFAPPTLAPLEMERWTGDVGDSTMLLATKRRGVSAAGLALLFAGVTAGVLIGVAALDPDAFGRGQAAIAERVSEPPRAVFEALPPPAPVNLQIDANATLLTFATSARPNVVIDGVAVPSAALPMKVVCGRHTLQVGASAPRGVDLPCGAPFALSE